MNCNQPLIICSFYGPPNKDILSVNNLCNLISNNITSTYPNVPAWLVGDLNLPKNNCTKDSAYPFVLCDTVINFVQEHGFSQAIDFPTKLTTFWMFSLLII